MHTPRFSGHPCSAGDFVLARICSRPSRTNCANVGTALPQSSKDSLLSPRPQTQKREVCRVAKQKGPATSEEPPGNSTPMPRSAIRATGHSGEAHSALRGWRPIPAALLTPFPLSCSGMGDLPFHQQRQLPPDKTISLRKKSSCVKQKTAQGAEIAFATRSSIDAANNIPPVVSGPVQWAKLVWPERLTL